MSTEPGPGVVLSGHLISEEIGRGGFSRVFRAEPVAGGPPVAIKVAVGPELVAALRAEGDVLRRIQGPRFVRILEEHVDADPPYVILEHCAGGDVRSLLDRSPERRLEPQRALELAREILEGVAFMHDEGVVHGDLKPENVLLDAEGHAKIADLGLSRSTRAELASVLERSAPTEGVKGTFDYVAPEVRAGKGLTPAADVFALGVVLYELVVGRRPLGRFELPGRLVPGVPPELDRVIAVALEPDPRRRYPDASFMLRDLAAGEVGIDLPVDEELHRTNVGSALEQVERMVFESALLRVLVWFVPIALPLILLAPDLGCFVIALGAVLGLFFLVPAYSRYLARTRAIAERVRRALGEPA